MRADPQRCYPGCGRTKDTCSAEGGRCCDVCQHGAPKVAAPHQGYLDPDWVATVCTADMSPRDFGEIAYESYRDSVGHVSITGNPLPSWEGQCATHPEIAAAWADAATAVRLAATAQQLHSQRRESP